MPVLMNHFVMLQRNLIYTGITRAKRILVMVGTKKALAYAVRNVTVTRRNTLLKEPFPVRQRIRGWSQRIEVTMEINKGGSASGVLKRKKKTSDGEKNNEEK